MLNEIIVITVIINALITGYLLGKISSQKTDINSTKINSFFDQQKLPKQNSIDIDNTKFVGDINTQGLEKKYNTLGDIQTTQDNISDSVNKLKNLKR
jgi:hypothetical protein